MKSIRDGFPFLIGVLLSACGGEGASTDEHGAVTQDPIINGTSVAPATLGIVLLSNGCTGTLITNTKVLTAKHCVEEYQRNPNGGPPTTPPFLELRMGNEWMAATNIWLHPTPNVDAAVVWLSGAFLINGSRTGFRRDIAMATADQLNNGALIIDGYGYGTAPTSGAGIARRGLCSAKKRANGLLSCFPAGNPATIQTWGDSGGPGSVYASGLPVVYIQSGCFFDNGVPTECYGNTSDTWLNWAWWYLL
jgi:trypsin